MDGLRDTDPSGRSINYSRKYYDASAKSQDFSAIFRAARELQQGGNKLRKSGVARCEKSAPEFMMEITRAARMAEKLRPRRIRFDKSKIRARARVTMRKSTRNVSGTHHPRRIRYRYLYTISIRFFFFSTRKILDGKRGKRDFEFACKWRKKLGVFVAELPLHSRASGVIKMCGLAKIRGEKERTALRVNYDAVEI